MEGLNERRVFGPKSFRIVVKFFFFNLQDFSFSEKLLTFSDKISILIFSRSLLPVGIIMRFKFL